jgi:DNA (cytosine-5)-methyltransferase 1
VAAYYNEWDPKIAAWLKELIRRGLVADGEVDTRSILDVRPDDLRGFTQCHFFAGIGGWSYALRLAGWPDDRESWTGSCPCQPWSVAGKGEGADDPRDLWPAWRELIAERSPAVVFGEQVASPDGLFWLDRVYVDMEAQAYALGTADLPAAGVGAPMASQRLFFVAEAETPREWRLPVRPGQSRQAKFHFDGHGEVVVDWLAAADSSHGHWWSGPLQVGWNAIEGEIARSGRRHRAQWRIKPGLSLLADGVPGRVALLGGFGNAIVPQVAAEFIAAYLEAEAATVSVQGAQHP